MARLGRGVAWLDSGTYDSLLAASQFVQTLELPAGPESGVYRRDCFRQGVHLVPNSLYQLAERYSNSSYGTDLCQRLSFTDPPEQSLVRLLRGVAPQANIS